MKTGRDMGVQEIESGDLQIKIRYIQNSNTFEFITNKRIMKVSADLLEFITNGDINTGKIFKIVGSIDTKSKPWETKYEFQEYIPPQNEEHDVA